MSTILPGITLPASIHAIRKEPNVCSSEQTGRFVPSMMSYLEDPQDGLQVRHKRYTRRILVRLERRCFGQYSSCYSFFGC